MNRILAIIILGMLFLSASSQKKCSKAEQIQRFKDQKASFISERIGLNDAASNRFWPIYNNYSHKKDSLIATRSMARRNLETNMANLTNAEKEALVDLQIRLR
ncbi:hypothetical protein EV194_11760, partial [Natronoflexus pectinivorans]